MNTFKKKSLYAALAGASALGVTGAAHAVNVNPDGLGQVLIYPYYTIQDKVPGVAFSSLLSVVNSTASVKAVKVRFLEGRASQEVLDFNLFLSPKDVWTAAVLPTGAGGAGVATFDKSCTVPTVSNDPAAPNAFRSTLYEGDLAGDEIARTKEGYVEIIEMGVPTNTAVVKSVTHVNGVPPCTGLTTLDSSLAMAPASGGLFGGMTLINVLAGEDYTADAVALADFRDDGLYEQPGSIAPDLSAVSPSIAIVTNGANLAGGGVLTSTDFIQSVDAVSALFMHDHIYNEFVLDSGTKSGTDWVVTFPTKRYYYTDVVDVPGVSREVQYLFQRDFTASGACDDVKIDVFDREERSVTSVDFSPSPGGPKICWEANVITFNNTNVFGSKNSRNIPTTFSNGWADLQFPVVGSAHKLVSGFTVQTSLFGQSSAGVATYLGLPVIGFAAISFQNGTLVDPSHNLVQSQYGGNFLHKSSRKVNYFPIEFATATAK